MNAACSRLKPCELICEGAFAQHPVGSVLPQRARWIYPGRAWLVINCGELCYFARTGGPATGIIMNTGFLWLFYPPGHECHMLYGSSPAGTNTTTPDGAFVSFRAEPAGGLHGMGKSISARANSSLPGNRKPPPGRVVCLLSSRPFHNEHGSSGLPSPCGRRRSPR